MHKCFRFASRLSARLFVAILVFLLFCSAHRTRAGFVRNACFDSWWRLPWGTYIDSLCPVNDDQKSCVEQTFKFSIVSGLLSINYIHDGFRYSLDINDTCGYLDAGFVIHATIKNKDSGSPELVFYAAAPENCEYILYAEAAKSEKFRGYRGTEHTFRAIPRTLSMAMRLGDIMKTCNLDYYPYSDFIIGTCKNRMTELKTVFLGSVKAIGDELKKKQYRVFVIENKSGRLKGKVCLDTANMICPPEEFPEQKALATCTKRGLDGVKIGDFVFCHDGQYSQEMIEVKGCNIQALAIDPEKGLLIAQCQGQTLVPDPDNKLLYVRDQPDDIGYLLNPAACLSAGLTFFRLKEKGVLLACELATASGIPVESDIPTQGHISPEENNDSLQSASGKRNEL